MYVAAHGSGDIAKSELISDGTGLYKLTDLPSADKLQLPLLEYLEMVGLCSVADP